jgi:glycosyltransferase involved in cell wall biosynthesis
MTGTRPVSVIVPTYNRDKLLSRCLTSILAAAEDNDEILVIDNGDTGRTMDVVAAFSDSRIRYVKEKDKGVSAARNLGMSIAMNDRIAFIDDDDEWHPQKLLIQRTLLDRHPEAVGCFSNIWATDPSGRIKRNYLFEWGQPVQDWTVLLGPSREISIEGVDDAVVYYLGEHYFNQMLDDYILPSSLLIDRARFKEELQFRPGMQRNESWLFTSQVCRQGPVIYVDIDLACHHGDAPNRLTAIPDVDTVLSRLYVLENEFGKRQDFLAEHQAEFEQRLGREANNLFRSVMTGRTRNRRQLLSAYAHLGGRVAAGARLPEPLLAGISAAMRLRSAARRLLGFDRQ